MDKDESSNPVVKGKLSINIVASINLLKHLSGSARATKKNQKTHKGVTQWQNMEAKATTDGRGVVVGVTNNKGCLEQTAP